MRTRLCLWYVVTYLSVTGLALLIAPAATLRVMHSVADYGTVMPRWVGMMSLALAALVSQVASRQLRVLYPLGFFMPAGMMVGFAGLYRESGDPLFLAILAVVGVGVALTGVSLLVDRTAKVAGRDAI